MGEGIRCFRDLGVWNDGVELAKTVYLLTERLPKSELFGLSSQLRRAAVSIPANIAEGNARSHRREYLQFLAIAAGSVAELTTLLVLVVEIYGLGGTEAIMSQCDRVGRRLTRLRQSLAQSVDRGPIPSP